MSGSSCSGWLLAAAAAILAATGTARAGEDRSGPFYQGGYVATMASYTKIDKEYATGNGLGGVLALGHRSDWWAIEIEGAYAGLKGRDGNGSAHLRGLNLSGLVFPLHVLPNLYGVAGFGGVEIQSYPGTDRDSFSVFTMEAGVGHLFAFHLGGYEMAVRAEARWRRNHREADISDVPRLNYNTPRNTDDVLFNLGLQFPIGKREPAPAPVETTPVVVEPSSSETAAP